MTLCSGRIGKDLIWWWHWYKKCVLRRCKAARRRTARFLVILVDEPLLLVSISQILRINSLKTCMVFQGLRQREWSLGLSLWEVEGFWRKTTWPSNYEGPALHFSVKNRMLTILLSWQVLRNLYLGCVEPDWCLSDILVIVCAGSSTWRGKLGVYWEGRFMAEKLKVRRVACWLMDGSAICEHSIWREFRPITLVFIHHFSKKVQ